MPPALPSFPSPLDRSTCVMADVSANALLDCIRGALVDSAVDFNFNADKCKFKCECYILTKEEGGRHTPFFGNYRPQFYFRTTDVTGACELPEGIEMVMPGDNIQMVVTLIAPIAMEDGLRFAIREGGRTVGAGVVAKIIE